MFTGCGLDIVGHTPLVEELNEERSKSPKNTPVVDSGEGRHEPDAANEHADASVEDAGTDANAIVDTGPCPASCTRCEGSTCVIECPGASCLKLLKCPPGRDCEIQCKGNSACSGMVMTCPKEYGCRVRCPGNQSCSSLSIEAKSSSKVCLTCDKENSCSAISAQVPSNTCRYQCGTSDDDDDCREDSTLTFEPNCARGPCL